MKIIIIPCKCGKVMGFYKEIPSACSFANTIEELIDNLDDALRCIVDSE